MEVGVDLIGVLDTLSGISFDDASVTELLDIQTVLEQVHRRVPALQHRVMAAVKAQAGPGQLGARSWKDFLGIRLRLSGDEAGRRLAEGELLGPRRTVAGQPLPPVFAATAAAQARGELTAAHVRIITTTMRKLPVGVDASTRADAEARLAAVAAAHDPDTVRRLATHLLEVLDPDGPEPNDDDVVERREDRRSFVWGPQDEEGMSEFCGKVTPQGRAYLEPIMGKLAGPGMCNPDDETPCTKGTPSQEAIDADTRTLGQRQHDALITVARNVLASGELGHHNGLPVTVVLGATAAELAEVGGQAVTAGGSRVPVREVIRMAAHAWWCLAVFDEVSGQPLYFGRTRRCASPDQRLVLTYQHRGCTYPGCRVPAYGCQVHHGRQDFAEGGAPISSNWYSRAGRITATSPRRAGRPSSSPTAPWNGSHPRPWTPAKPAPTSTTTPNSSWRTGSNASNTRQTAESRAGDGHPGVVHRGRPGERVHLAGIV